MTTLAPKLPYTHPFAGGYPRIGGQPLPTDPDAIDYLSRVAAADGAAVEVGVAMAVDQFIKGCKADSAGYAGDPTRTVWDALKSACIMCGARTLSGALVSLKSYGDELMDIATLDAATIENAGGSSGQWDAETKTASNTVIGTNSSYPRFQFLTAMSGGKEYLVTGRISGDIASVYGIRAAATGSYVTLDVATGSFSGVISPTGPYLQLLLNGTQTASVTIESLSIKEYFANPTNVANNFVSSDYSRTTGLKGDGIGKYLDSNRANDADGQNDNHLAVYATEKGSVGKSYIGVIPSGATNVRRIFLRSTGTMLYYANDALLAESSVWDGTATLHGVARTGAASGTARSSGTDYAGTAASSTPPSLSQYVFAQNNNGTADGFSSGRLAFYSIGSALDLAALDNRVTQLVTGIKFHSLTGLVATDYDPDTVAYIVAAYEAGGTL